MGIDECPIGTLEGCALGCPHAGVSLGHRAEHRPLYYSPLA